jgi:hypothetical protein
MSEPVLQRLTENEMKLKSEISLIVRQLNYKLFEAEKSGINVSISSKVFNDGFPDYYIGVAARITVDV